MTNVYQPIIDGLKDVTIPMTVADPDKADCPIVYCNAAFEDLTGYRFADIVGNNCRFLQGEATNRAEVERLKDSIAKREDNAVCLFNYQANGTPFHNFLIVRPFRMANGKNLLLGCQYHFEKFNGYEAFEMHNQRVQGVMEERLAAPDHAQAALEGCMQLRANTIRTKIQVYMMRAADDGIMDLSA